MRVPLAFIVEGFCEYDNYPSIVSKIIGPQYCPISNAKGIGNITKNAGDELLKLVKFAKPKRIIITLDYREALREKIVNNCIELKELIQVQVDEFLRTQENGSLTLPEEIIVVVTDKTFESWICADYEALKTNELFEASRITESYNNVDIEIPNPSSWLNTKLKENLDLKSKANRKIAASCIRPEIAKENSRSFRKFYEEISKSKVA